MATLPVPGDLIPEILSRLGVKGLLRFRCVSKPWCSLIDDPDFIKLHLSRSRKTNTHFSLVFQVCHLIPVDFNSFFIPPTLNHPFSDEAFCSEVLGSCNGLLALHNGEQDIALCNPLKRKSHMLPFNEIKFPPYFCFLQFIVYGFGHDPISDDYKLVRMVQYDGKDDDSFGSEVKVYSLRTNSWRRIKDFPFYLYKRAGGYLQGEYGVLANNALHWVVSKKPNLILRALLLLLISGLRNIVCDQQEGHGKEKKKGDGKEKQKKEEHQEHAISSPSISTQLNHPFSDEAFCTEVLGSCNGLLALHNGEQDIALWNPLKRKSHMLPLNEIKFPPYFCFLQFIVYGFGHDPISDDYKLVRMVQFSGKDDDSFGSEVKVYSLRTNSWKRIKDFPCYLYKRADGYLQGEYGVFANNALHWVVSKKPKSDTKSFIVAFDIGTEEY
ncbi:hypothetical protein V6N11_013473 [Hibiscus sabdariffa]|uniref:F-box domain-containing protein n=1 Tax=Hibiscus sabdariffa TaxID=183260 RepID=A0ABR2NNF5_9ROSI